MPLDEIRGKYDHVFDASGAIVEDLESLPYEINQEEVELFDADENKVTRRHPLYDDEPNKGAILIELSMASQMFADPSDDNIFNIEEEDDDQNQELKHSLGLYPLAFLGHYGQLQSNSILPAFGSIIRKVVEQIGEESTTSHGVEHRTIHTLRGVFLQMYQASFLLDVNGA